MMATVVVNHSGDVEDRLLVLGHEVHVPQLRPVDVHAQVASRGSALLNGQRDIEQVAVILPQGSPLLQAEVLTFTWRFIVALLERR